MDQPTTIIYRELCWGCGKPLPSASEDSPYCAACEERQRVRTRAESIPKSQNSLATWGMS